MSEVIGSKQNEERYLDIHQASSDFKLSTSFLYKLSAGRKIDRIKIGKKILFKKSTLDAYMDSHEIKADNLNRKRRAK